jgi:hypothetical protein
VGKPFALDTVVHLIRPWGTPARDLQQLRDGIAAAPVEVLFRHAVQYQLRDPGADELARDDFTAWVGGVVQDAETAERLSFAAQNQNTSAETARASILAVLDALSPRRRERGDAPEGSEFVFLAAYSFRYPTGVTVHDPHDVVDALVESDPGVWFTHLIEEPWYHAGRGTLVEWLDRNGHARLATWFHEAARSGHSVERARARLSRRWQQSQLGLRLARATAAPETERREAGREAIARLVRRRAPKGDAS